MCKKGSLDSASEIITFRKRRLSQTETTNNTGYTIALLFVRTFVGDHFILYFGSCMHEGGYVVTSKIMLMVILFKIYF
jgi:hypothetical protein